MHPNNSQHAVRNDLVPTPAVKGLPVNLAVLGLPTVSPSFRREAQDRVYQDPSDSAMLSS